MIVSVVNRSRRTAVAALVVALVFLVAACSQNGDIENVTFTGVITAEPQGDPLQGARVAFGEHSATTNFRGEYEIPVPIDEAPSITSVAVWKDSNYRFLVAEDLSFDQTGGTSYDFRLRRTSALAVPTTELVTTYKDTSGNTVTGTGFGDLFLLFVTQEGLSASGRYTFDAPTLMENLLDPNLLYLGGSDFMLFVVSSETGNYWYEPFDSMSAFQTTLELQEPPASDFTTVSVSGTGTAYVTYYVPGYPVTQSGDAIVNNGSIDVYTGGDAQVRIVSNTFDASAGTDSSALQHTFAPAFGSVPGAVNTAGRFTMTRPDRNVDLVNTFSWNRDSRTIGFDPVTHIDHYYLQLSSNDGLTGEIHSSTTSIVLPTAFVEEVIDNGIGWDVTGEGYQYDPAWTLETLTPAGRFAWTIGAFESIRVNEGTGGSKTDAIP